MGSPSYPPYHRIYALIGNEARKRSFNEIMISNWPGHECFKRKAQLSLMNALPYGVDYINRMESRRKEYYLVATSFGCLVALRALEEFNELKYLKAITIWGIVPFWLTYYYFKQRIKEIIPRIKERKRTDLAEDYFDGHKPIELMLDNYDKNILLRVAIGENDKYSTPSFMNYLEEIITNPMISFNIAPEALHSVREPNKAYFDILFNH